MVTRLDTILYAGSPRAGITAETLQQYATVDGDYATFTYRDADGRTQHLRLLLPEQPEAFQRRAAYKSSLPFTEADFLDATRGATSMSEVISLVTGSVAYTAFWQPADRKELRSLRVLLPDSHAGMLDPHVNHLPFFNAPAPLEVDGVDGYMWVSKDNTRVANVVGGRWIMSTAGADFPPFPRRMAIKLAPANDVDALQTFTEADFLDTGNGTLSYTELIEGRHQVGASVQNYHQGIWVPDDKPDPDSLFEADAGGVRNTFGGNHMGRYARQPGIVTVAGVDGKVWRSTSGIRSLGAFGTLAHPNFIIGQTPEA